MLFRIVNFINVSFLVWCMIIPSCIPESCPSRCTCVQRTVRCMRLQLTDIPVVLSDTKIVDLRYNHIEEIPSNSFQRHSELHSIFLNENHITTIGSAAFQGLSSLRYLYLNNNRINKIAADAFHGLNRLQNLYLQSNELLDFNVRTFSNLPRLERLFLNNNKITTVPMGAFRNTKSLKHLRLENNAINCDCSIVWLIKLSKRHKSFLTTAITCSSPKEMVGKPLHRINELDFKCEAPHISIQPQNILANLGDTAKFECRATGDPKPNILWMRNANNIILPDSKFHLLDDGTLKIERVDSSTIGQYECVAKNEFGVAKSRPVRMAVEQLKAAQDEQPRIVLSPNDVTITSINDIIALHCIATGIPEPAIHWYINGVRVTQSTETSNVYDNGTLIIKNPNVNVTGTYKCEAVNYLGTVSSTANVKVNVLPHITIPPENQTIKDGTYVILECEAVGVPAPKILWKRNDRFIEQSNRIFFDNENTELHIQHAKLTDAGRYICIAENSIGTAESVADITVEVTARPPKLLFEPYDIEAIPDTTIELPCKAEGDTTTEVKWKKDGKTLNPSVKYRFAVSGSLYIQKITDQDAGRYECTVSNTFGRTSASGLVTVSNNDVQLPGERIVRIAFAEASHEIDVAINQTISNLFDVSTNENTRNPGNLFKAIRYPNAPTRELARAAEIYERTLVNIRKKIDSGATVKTNMSDFHYKDILSREHLNLVAELSGCMSHRIITNCTNMCFHMKYRSIDGTCNNLQHPNWGASLTGFRRILKPIYENGFSTPIGWTKGKLYNGYALPSARLVSTRVISTKDITPDTIITHMVMQWGQFLDHDLDHAIPSVSSESWDGVDCKKTCEYSAPCYPIEVPPNDPRIKNRRCIDLVRSSAICGSGMTSIFFGDVQPREQINQLTSYIDASQVYGYTNAFAQDLRNLATDKGLLRTGVHFAGQKSLLPFSAPTDGVDCRRDIAESNVNCFTAGDIRVNEQIGLAAMHTIWLREHNRLADELHELNPHWDGDTLYYEARKIVGAEMQHITYAHWLPNILGPGGIKMLNEHYNSQESYDPTVEPSISNEFATAALRFGHTLINPILHRLNESFETIEQGHLPLHKAFFAPWRLVYEGGVDPLLRGMFTVPAKLKMPTQNLNTELTEKLFLTAHAVALDLAAINIQRSRDHAIPSYNMYRKVCNMTAASTFDDLSAEISNDDVREKLKTLYGHPDNIDLFVGGILEDQVDGGRVGPLFQCLLIEQFKRLRAGDRHWYESPSTFPPEQLMQIKLTSLARILCDNGDNITEINPNVFHLPDIQGGRVKCSEIPKINLGFWLNCDKCSAHLNPNLPRVDPNLPSNINNRLQRRRRNVSLNVSSVENDHDIIENDDENFVDMNDERIDGLEALIDTFQKTLKQLRKRVKKLEQTCSSTFETISTSENNTTSSSSKFVKINGHHCIDDAGIRRFNDEIWSKDNCTKCECKHRQVNCVTEKCQLPVYCGKGIKPIRLNSTDCCEICPLSSTKSLDD